MSSRRRVRRQCVICEGRDAKWVKTQLQAEGQFDQETGIRKPSQIQWLNPDSQIQDSSVVVPANSANPDDLERKFPGLQIQDLEIPCRQRKTVESAIREFVQDQTDSREQDKVPIPGYVLHEPMILFRTGSFQAHYWDRLLSAGLLEYIAQTTGYTHIAINSPIPGTDRLRRPTNLITRYGDFGEWVEHEPSQADFERAFWVRLRQNGIAQVYAPLYTMVSRGNIVEKKRVLSFGEAKDEVIVDLYTGIGYFAFSYLKQGARQVIGWDLNRWSVQGFARGAALNGWSCRVVDADDGTPIDQIRERAVVFCEDNRNARTRLRGFQGIRHVNLGLLPSSEPSWETASGILDRQRGGWIHVHETIARGQEEARVEMVRARFQEYGGGQWQVDAHLARVKEYAPGWVHYVIDVHCTVK